jgi:hypothetical protein
MHSRRAWGAQRLATTLADTMIMAPNDFLQSLRKARSSQTVIFPVDYRSLCKVSLISHSIFGQRDTTARN